MPMRDCEITTLDGGDVTGEWAEMQVEGRIITSATFCEFDLAEEVIGLLQFKDGTLEVGVGECLRPYLPLYVGGDVRAAEACFMKAVTEHALG